MLARHLVPAFLLLLSFSIVASAQRADVAFVVGGSFVSDSKADVVVPTTSTVVDTIKTDHRVSLSGAVAVQLLNARLFSLHAELPVAGISSQTLRNTGTTPSTVLDHISTTFVTPSLKLKLLPLGGLSPFASVGAGLAHYALGGGSNTKGALQYGGGVDLKTGFPHLGVRVEARDFVSGNPNFGLISSPPVVAVGGLTNNSSQTGLHRHNVLVGGGVVVSF